MALLIAFLFVLMCVVGIASLSLRRNLRQVINSEHPELARELALHKSILDRGPKDGFRLISFIMNDRKWPDDSGETRSIIEKCRRFDIAYLVLFGLVVALLVLYLN